MELVRQRVQLERDDRFKTAEAERAHELRETLMDLAHRFGLDDAILIKDNHILAAGGLVQAVERVRGGVGHMVKIEVEVDTLSQLKDALAICVDTILLDNMSEGDMRQAVTMAAGRAVLEASGGITLERVRAVAETGVDYISSGAITHSASNLDIGLDFL